MRQVPKTELSPDNGCVIATKWKVGPLSYHTCAAEPVIVNDGPAITQFIQFQTNTGLAKRTQANSGSDDRRWFDIQGAATFSYNPVGIGTDRFPIVAGGICPAEDAIPCARNCIHQWWIVANNRPWQVQFRNNRDLAAMRFQFAVWY